MSTTITLPQLNAPSVPVIGSDIIHGFRQSAPVGEQDVQILVQAIYDQILATVAAQNQGLINTVNALTAMQGQFVEDTEKGVTVATLEGGKIPLSQMPISGLTPKGNWNAATNTPALSDATGSSGWWYKSTTANASINLGSGTLNVGVGAWLIHNGTKWEVNSDGLTVTINGVSGTVFSLTTANIPDSSGKRYIPTEDILAALLNTTGIPASGNPFVLNNDPRLLTTQGVVINNEFFSPRQYEKNGVRADDGTVKMLSALGWTNVSAAAAWPRTNTLWAATGGIDVNTAAYADVVLQETFLAMEYEGYKTVHFPDNACYDLMLPFGMLVIPTRDRTRSDTKNTFILTFEFNGAAFRNRSGAAKTIFHRAPTSSSEADQNTGNGPYIETAINMSNFALYGAALAAGSGDKGIFLGSTYNSVIEKGFVADFDIGIHHTQALLSKVSNVKARFCRTNAFLADTATWTGASIGNSVSQMTYNDCRAYAYLGSTPFKSRGGDSTRFDHCFIEGDNPLVGIDIDSRQATVTRQHRINDTRFETECTQAGIRMRGQTNIFMVDGIYNAAKSGTAWTKTLFEFVNTVGVNTFDIRNIQNYSGANWKMNYIMEDLAANGAILDFKNVYLQGNPVTAADVVNTVGFPNIWKAGSQIPLVGRVTQNCKY